MIERLSHYLVCNLICIRGTQVVAAKSECRHLNAGASQCFLRYAAFGALQRNSITRRKRTTRHKRCCAHDCGSLHKLSTTEMRLLRIHDSSFITFSAERDGPYSQPTRACLEPPIAWYQAGTRVQDELPDYRISATACRAHTFHRPHTACSEFAVRPFRQWSWV